MGDFLRATGPGAGVRGDFSTDGVPLVRWASADLGPFSTFFAFLARFLPVFRPYLALFPSMSCAYLYVHNFPPPRVSRIGRGNLAFDKETAEATRKALSGRGLTAKHALSEVEGYAKDAKGELGSGNDEIRRPNDESNPNDEWRRTAKRRSRPAVSSLKPQACR